MNIKKVFLEIYFLLRLPFLYLLKFLLYVEYALGGESPAQLPSKILIIRIDRIGDFILSLPTIKALKENFNNSKITIIVPEYLKDLAESHKYIDNVLLYNKNDSLLKKILFLKKLKTYSFDLAIDMHLDYKIKTAIIAYISNAPVRIGFSWGYREVFFTNSIKPELKNSLVDITYSLLSVFGIKGKPDNPEIEPSEEAEKRIAKFFEDNGIFSSDFIIGIHPGGFYESQRLPLNKFAELINLIKEKFHAKFIIFGSKNETELIEKLKDKIFLTVTDFSISEIVALISKLNLLICNNSGPLHIACALSIPTVSTMGSTDPYLWMPRGDKNIVIRKDLPCSPCNKGKCKTHECMDLITVEDMMNAVETQLKEMIY